MSESGIIVEVDFKPRQPSDGELDPLLRVKRKWETPGCHHEAGAFIVDEALRRVTCKVCGETLDPIQALLDLARRWESYRNQLGMLANETKRRAAHVEELKREEANLRGRVKRLRDKETPQ